jgi:hypothetical protein
MIEARANGLPSLTSYARAFVANHSQLRQIHHPEEKFGLTMGFWYTMEKGVLRTVDQRQSNAGSLYESASSWAGAVGHLASSTSNTLFSFLIRVPSSP